MVSLNTMFTLCWCLWLPIVIKHIAAIIVQAYFDMFQAVEMFLPGLYPLGTHCSYTVCATGSSLSMTKAPKYQRMYKGPSFGLFKFIGNWSNSLEGSSQPIKERVGDFFFWVNSAEKWWPPFPRGFWAHLLNKPLGHPFFWFQIKIMMLLLSLSR